MSYTAREIYYTLQGEGARTGRPAVFLRFAGCNLWSGRERDRAGAVCRFCDTQFVGTGGPGGGKFRSATELAVAVDAAWPRSDTAARKYVVCTGGEPLLQLDPPLVAALHARGFEIAVETNGTITVPPGVDWICVSPKGSAAIEQRRGNELKLVYPQTEPEAQPDRFIDLDFAHFFIQPLDDAQRDANLRAAIEFCKANPRWRLSLQVHKLIGIA